MENIRKILCITYTWSAFFTRPEVKEFQVAVRDGSRLVKCKLVLVPSKANYCIIPPAPLVAFAGTRQGTDKARDLATIKKRRQSGTQPRFS